MDRALWEQHLELAERHIALARRIVDQQRSIVAELRKDGHSIVMAERILNAYEDLLALHLTDRDRLKKDLARQGPRSPV